MTNPITPSPPLGWIGTPFRPIPTLNDETLFDGVFLDLEIVPNGLVRVDHSNRICRAVGGAVFSGCQHTPLLMH